MNFELGSQIALRMGLLAWQPPSCRFKILQAAESLVGAGEVLAIHLGFGNRHHRHTCGYRRRHTGR